MPGFVNAQSSDHAGSFTDLPTSEIHYDAVEHLVNEGTIMGYEDGTFKPYQAISRAQVAVILARQLNLPIPADVDGVLAVYEDVEAIDDHADEIAAVTDASVFQGSDGAFHPNTTMTREQLATVFYEGFGLDQQEAEKVEINMKEVDGAHQESVQVFANLGLTTELDDFKPRANLPRAQFASFLYATLNVLDPDGQEESDTSQLSNILDEGVIRVGTTGDYKPFTYLNPDTEEFEGSDIDAAKLLAEDLGVEVEFVQTSWPTLMEDLLDGKFDIAMGGITRTLDREKEAHLSKPYTDFGKAAIIREEDKEKFTSIDDMNQPDVRVGVNPGGTNEAFVLEHLTNANVTEVENNLEIPGKVAEGEFDVMITDSMEAVLYSNEDARLYPAFKENTLTNSQMGYLMQSDEPAFHNWINLWIDEMTLDNRFETLEKDWMS